MALYSPYSNIRPRFSEYDELPDGEPVYSQGLLSPDIGQQVPQVQTAAPQVQAAPVRQGNWSPFQGSVDDGTSYVPYGGVNWAGLPGYESFIKPASGGGDNYEEAGINTQAFRDYIAQNGYTFQEDSLGRDDSGDSAFTRYAIDRDGNTVEASRINGSYESSQNLLSRAAKLAAVMGTAYLGGTALEGLIGGSGAATGAGSLTAGITPEAVAAAELGLPAAAAPTNLTPAAMESLLGTPGYGVNAAAQGVAQAAGMDVGLVGSGAALPFESIGSLAPSPSTASETFRPSDNYGDGMSGAQTGTYDKVLEATGSKTAADLATTVASPFDAFKTWSAANPMLSKLLFTGATSLLSASGGGGGSKGGYVDSGYRPTISRGGFQARVPTAPTNGPTGLLNPSMKPVTLPSTGQANDGLWRYGLLGPGRG